MGARRLLAVVLRAFLGGTGEFLDLVNGVKHFEIGVGSRGWATHSLAGTAGLIFFYAI